MNVVFVASEAVPFAKTGGLADVAGALPRALAKQGHSVAVFLPCYRRVWSAGVRDRSHGDHPSNPDRRPVGRGNRLREPAAGIATSGST